jgi:CheY-like chemotaxis protein
VILLVDDNRGLCEVLMEFLSLRDRAAQYAANGNEALRLIADTQIRPEIILLDLVMPELDGWGFLAERGKDPWLADVPVVVMSGCRDVAPRAKTAGATAVVRKPVEPHTLLRVIEHFDHRT